MAMRQRVRRLARHMLPPARPTRQTVIAARERVHLSLLAKLTALNERRPLPMEDPLVAARDAVILERWQEQQGPLPEAVTTTVARLQRVIDAIGREELRVARGLS